MGIFDDDEKKKPKKEARTYTIKELKDMAGLLKELVKK